MAKVYCCISGQRIYVSRDFKGIGVRFARHWIFDQAPKGILRAAKMATTVDEQKLVILAMLRQLGILQISDVPAKIHTRDVIKHYDELLDLYPKLAASDSGARERYLPRLLVQRENPCLPLDDFVTTMRHAILTNALALDIDHECVLDWEEAIEQELRKELQDEVRSKLRWSARTADIVAKQVGEFHDREPQTVELYRWLLKAPIDTMSLEVGVLNVLLEDIQDVYNTTINVGTVDPLYELAIKNVVSKLQAVNDLHFQFGGGNMTARKVVTKAAEYTIVDVEDEDQDAQAEPKGAEGGKFQILPAAEVAMMPAVERLRYNINLRRYEAKVANVKRVQAKLRNLVTKQSQK